MASSDVVAYQLNPNSQSDFSLEVEPKTYLQNKLAQDENELDEVLPKVNSMRNEVAKLEELRKAYIENPALGDLDSVVEVRFALLTLRANPCRPRILGAAIFPQRAASSLSGNAARNA